MIDILKIHFQNNVVLARLCRMSRSVEPFRQRYRAAISPRYSVWTHAGFVLLYGLGCIVWLASTIDTVSPWEWLTVPVALVFFNWGEYTVHKQLGHVKTRWGSLFYQRHTGDHHSFFVEGHMRYEQPRDWRVILFPAWLVVIFSAVAWAVWWGLGQALGGAVGALFAITLLAGYLSYEILHACEHLPGEHPVARLPWVRHMRRLHELHHRPELMRTRNFNIVFPLTDWLMGTLHWEPPAHARHPRPPHPTDH